MDIIKKPISDKEYLAEQNKLDILRKKTVFSIDGKPATPEDVIIFMKSTVGNEKAIKKMGDGPKLLKPGTFEYGVVEDQIKSGRREERRGF